MSELELIDVHKRYRDQSVLEGVDLTVAPESMTAVLGPSGSGKTTLLRLVAGFDRIDQGQIRIGGVCVDDGRRPEPPERRQLGYVPQEGALFPHLTVAANVGFGLPRGTRRKERVRELVEMVGLDGFERRYPDQLSGGQQQRVALARALAVDPAVVLLDEPFSALDATLRTSIRTEVRDILRAAGATTIIVTHDQDEALSLADRVAILRDGRIVQHGRPHDLYSRPADSEVARFLGEANLLDALVAGSAAVTILGRLTLTESYAEGATTTELEVMVRPEQVEIAVEGSSDRSGTEDGSTVTGHVVQSDFHGHYTILHIRLDRHPDAAEVLARHEGLEPLTPGTGVTLSVRGQALAWSKSA